MKQEYDKEIDSLLRRSARVAAAGSPSAEGARASFASSHLDADELSAFAENALPASARLAAASHLADCDDCRGVVVRLASAADAAGEIEKRAAASPVVPVETPWWKTLLGSLFNPRVLRYAAPVLVLGLVGVVSFIALRTRQGSVPATVVRNEEARDAAAPPSQGETTTGTSATASADLANANAAPTPAGPSGLFTVTTKPDEQPAVNQPAAPVVAGKDAAPAESAGDVVAGKKAGPPGEGELKREERDALAANTVAAPAATTQPPPAPKAAASEVAEQQPKGARPAEAPRKEPDDSYVYNERAQPEQNRAATQARNRQGEALQMPDGGGSQRNDGRAMNNRGNVGGVHSLPSTRAQRAPAARRKAEDSKARETAGDDDETVRVGETRSVAGRRFRREGNVWVDASYKSSMSMTGVRRGTEAYRALVADIPELGRIAEQLGGEVIAVVKGRAYRIR